MTLLKTVHVPGTVNDVVDQIRAELDRLGVTLFTVIDHAAGARGVGLELADEMLLVFGNPLVGTALMQSDPRVGLDLPLRMLVWDDNGDTCVGYEEPARLGDRYRLADHEATLARLTGVFDHLVAVIGAEAGS